MSKDYKLIGLNRRPTSGVYATVEYGKEDWFHADFDEAAVSIDRQNALFDIFKNTEENLWSNANHKVKVQCDGFSSSGAPINPIIKELLLDI